MERFGISDASPDPYGAFRFRLHWNGRPVAGVSKVLALTSHGGLATLTLESGVSQDPEFVQWAGRVWPPGAGAGTPPDAFRRDLRIDLHDEAGQLALSYPVVQAWLSDFQALPGLGGDAVVIRSMRLETEGWEPGAGTWTPP